MRESEETTNKFSDIIDYLNANLSHGDQIAVAELLEDEHHKEKGDGFDKKSMKVRISKMLNNKIKVKHWEMIIAELDKRCSPGAELIDNLHRKVSGED